MHPNELIAETTTPSGAPISLVRQSGALMVIVAGVTLMSSRLHGSEDELGALAGKLLVGRPGARVLVGGLGMGFTLRAALDALPADARLTVSELVPALVEWNRGPLGPLADHPLNDSRVTLRVGDVGARLCKSAGSFDAILLDVDNGPEELTATSNAWLYGAAGLATIRAALRPGGFVVVWSAYRSPAFERRLRQAGFRVEILPVRARGTVAKGAKHLLFVGHLPG